VSSVVINTRSARLDEFRRADSLSRSRACLSNLSAIIGSLLRGYLRKIGDLLDSGTLLSTLTRHRACRVWFPIR
jgi:hypothetical protein